MKNRKGFYLTNILFKISIVLLLINIGFAHINRQNEKREIKEAKLKIYNTVKTYANSARSKNEEYRFYLNYETKEIRIKYYDSFIEKIQLPKNLYYATIFGDAISDYSKQTKFDAKITRNGNITPSFSVYIFDYSKIARYRISFDGFQTIKFLEINIYRNHVDKDAKYEKILKYHRKLEKNENYFNTYWHKE